MDSQFPTHSQKRTLWIALTALATVTIGAIAVGVIWLGTWILGYLQPLLIPFAVAGVLAYLLYPLVRKLKERGMEPKRAGTLVFSVFMVLSVALMTFVVSTGVRQASSLKREFPAIKKKFENVIDNNSARFDKWGERFGMIFQGATSPEDPAAGSDETPPPEEAPTGTPAPLPPGEDDVSPDTAGQDDESSNIGDVETEAGNGAGDEVALLKSAIDWLNEKYPELGNSALRFIRESVGGFLGTFGFILGFFIVPIYLFFFLREAYLIQERWTDYLPLRASRFKNEMVATLKEINDYLIAFFRGQMLVSLIDGLITAVVLTLVGMKFGLLIGLLVGILGIVPYLGIIACYIPAIMIATAQGASKDWNMLGFIHIDAAPWVLPLVVTIIFIAVQNIDGMLIAPKIVGDSVGLHPFTVIFSVLFWSTVLGGLLGSILAVPLTAALKVLFTRYVWTKKLRPGTVGGAAKPLEPSRPLDRAPAP